MGLFDLDMFNESSNDDDILDLSLDESAEDFNVDDDDDEALLEATRYDLEFEKAFDNYKKAWNEHKKYVDKMNKLLDDASSDDQKDRITNKIKKKDEELENLRKQLLKKYRNTHVGTNKSLNNYKNNINYCLTDISEDPNDFHSAHELGNKANEKSARGKSISDSERMNGLHGANIKDKIGGRKPGRYNFKESGEDFDLDDMFDESSNEFAPGSNATNDVDNGEKDAKISVPGKVELTSDTYNKAISALKQSFKESIDVLSMLENADIVKKTQEEKNAEILESVMIEAAYNAMVDGPIFEAADNKDKNDIKSIVTKLQDPISKAFIDENKPFVKFTKKDNLLKIIANGAAFATAMSMMTLGALSPLIGLVAPAALIGTSIAAGALSGTALAALDRYSSFWQARAWQIVGSVWCEEQDIAKIVNDLNDKYADELGVYRVLYTSTFLAGLNMENSDKYKSLRRKDRNKAFKADRAKPSEAYTIIIDRKLPSEIAKIENDTKSVLKKDIEKSIKDKDSDK